MLAVIGSIVNTNWKIEKLKQDVFVFAIETNRNKRQTNERETSQTIRNEMALQQRRLHEIINKINKLII